MTFRRLPSVLLALLAALVFPAASSAEQVVSKSAPHAMASSSVAPTPSARTIARARVAGLPAVDPAARISGPFDGPEGTLYYLDRDSHISYFHPEGATAYFGDLADDGSVHFRYGLNISGQYVFSADGQVQQVRVLPDDVSRWPHAQAIAQVCELTWQIRGQAEGRQVEGAKVGVTANQGLFGHGSSVVVKG